MTVQLIKTRQNLNESAKELSIRVELLYRWRNEVLDKGAGNLPGRCKPKHTPEEAETARLMKFLLDVKTEKDKNPVLTHVCG